MSSLTVTLLNRVRKWTQIRIVLCVSVMSVHICRPWHVTKIKTNLYNQYLYIIRARVTKAKYAHVDFCVANYLSSKKKCIDV